jgi:hypothetical protein
MEPMKVVTAQHAARAHEAHEKFDSIHNEINTLGDWVWTKLCTPADKTAQITAFAARTHASTKTSEIGKEIATSRVLLRCAKHDMMLMRLQERLDDLKLKVSELQAWEVMSPLLDSCPE